MACVCVITMVQLKEGGYRKDALICTCVCIHVGHCISFMYALGTVNGKWLQLSKGKTVYPTCIAVVSQVWWRLQKFGKYWPYGYCCVIIIGIIVLFSLITVGILLAPLFGFSCFQTKFEVSIIKKNLSVGWCGSGSVLSLVEQKGKAVVIKLYEVQSSFYIL